ncbi:pyrroloquinoline quinone precursor peptide PqqA [Streptomyces sp. NPDC053048]|uniref:pyrroloquinoline quinone precursor peptide PqqA n=1 Tax=Streptomyces sp. NPDC053048 TaxID=3365694 RepID=UPI0037D0030A
MTTAAATTGPLPAVMDRSPGEDADGPARAAWIPPDFTDVELGAEVTAYAGRW